MLCENKHWFIKKIPYETLVNSEIILVYSFRYDLPAYGGYIGKTILGGST